jgi:cytochrome c-type biogenesis protein CcmH/NrfF
MTLLWAVPLLAVVAALGMLLGRLRSVEDLASDLARTVRRSAEVRVSLRAVRRELDRSEPLVDRVWSHWSGDDEQA